MRAIRVLFMVILAAVLVLVASANREIVTVNLIPESLAPFTGGQWSLSLPAFVALFLAMVFGMVVGLIWEWLRESRQRSESSRRAHELSVLQREVGELRRTHAKPRDEVLAILDEAKTRKAGAKTLPAPR